MKNRFKNILNKKGKTNGVLVLICAVTLTIGLGTMIGCSAAKSDTGAEDRYEDMKRADTGNADIETADIGAENTENVSDRSERESKQATLMHGDGYSIYLPDEEWQMTGPDLWLSDINEEVALWVTHFEGETADLVSQSLESDGYTKEDDGSWSKQEEDRVYHVRLRAFDDVWGIFYSYPPDFEEDWGRKMHVIADTFALSE